MTDANKDLWFDELGPWTFDDRVFDHHKKHPGAILVEGKIFPPIDYGRMLKQSKAIELATMSRCALVLDDKHSDQAIHDSLIRAGRGFGKSLMNRTLMENMESLLDPITADDVVHNPRMVTKATIKKRRSRNRTASKSRRINRKG